MERDRVIDEAVEVLVIGGGFGGLQIAGARAPRSGLRRTSGSIEKGGDFGGTWYWNRYPGAQCDVESYIYLPLLEELGYDSDREVRPSQGDPGDYAQMHRATLSSCTTGRCSRPK